MSGHGPASSAPARGFIRTLRRGAGKLLRAVTGRRVAHPPATLPAPTAPATAAPTTPAAQQRRQLDISDDPQRQVDPAEVERHKAEYDAQAKHFRREVVRRGLGDANKFYWYHTVDLGDGLVTPGDYDYRGLLGDYPFPKDMHGLSALDVGSATGFFAFEFERRGAEVTSVELPSMADWDMIWSDRDILLPRLLARRETPSIQEWDRLYTHGPFDFCHRMLRSRVRRCLSRIYDLTPQKLGRDQFDFIFLGDVLGHLFSPLAALNVLAPLCRREMIISMDLVEQPGSSMWYGGGEDCDQIGRSWFQPNWECMRQMLKRVGFREVKVHGMSRVLLRRTGWIWMDRQIIQATR
jgi:tRNA (mo5U34)-methyltransferase